MLKTILLRVGDPACAELTRAGSKSLADGEEKGEGQHTPPVLESLRRGFWRRSAGKEEKKKTAPPCPPGASTAVLSAVVRDQ